VNRKADFKKKNESIRIDSLKMNRWIDSNRESECSTRNCCHITASRWSHHSSYIGLLLTILGPGVGFKTSLFQNHLRQFGITSIKRILG